MLPATKMGFLIVASKYDYSTDKLSPCFSFSAESYFLLFKSDKEHPESTVMTVTELLIVWGDKLFPELSDAVFFAPLPLLYRLSFGRIPFLVGR